MHHYSATLGPLPAGKQVVLQTNIKLIEYPIDGLVDDIVQALWPVVKSRYRRHYHRPQLCGLNQQTQMAKWNGVSRTQSTSGRRSFSTTSAARVSRPSV